MATVSDKLFEILKGYVDTVFFLPGGGSMFLVDALGRSGLNYVTALHEQGCGYMAVGYAQVKNSLGVCLTTSGPGATNAITACTAAWMDSVPVLFISGNVMTKDMIGNTYLRSKGGQEVNIIPIVKPITKFAVRLMPNDKGNISGVIYAIERCLDARRGPCWIDVPLDVQKEEL